MPFTRFICLCCLLLGPSPPGHASDRKIYPYRIEAGPMAESLTTLSKRFAIPILFKSADVTGRESPAIEGPLPLEEALARLLHGSGLSYHRGANGVVIRRLSAAELPEGMSQSQISEVIVEGFRQSLLNARDLKQDANGVQDSILAEDIAEFPDLNLAESLQRIPGVAITREGGEGRQIALRGLGPEFTLVRLNGIEVLANSDSPMDSRGQKTRDRAFDFNIFASELFSEVTVHKTYSAARTEGGLAGSVALRAPKPFERPGFNAAVSAQVGVNDYTDDGSPRFAGLVSNTWDQFGALLSIAHSRRDTEEQGANTTRWRNESPNGADISALDPTLQAAWRAGDLFVPRGNRYSVWQNTQERLGITSALQLRTERFELDLDWLFSELDNDRSEYHLYPRGVNSTPVIAGLTSVEAAAVNADDELIYAEYSDAQMATESRRQTVITTFNHYSMLARWHVTDSLRIEMLIGVQSSDFEIPDSDKIYTEGISDVTIDYTQDPYFGTYSYTADTRDSDNWWMHEIDLEEYYATTDYETVKLDALAELTPNSRLRAGLSTKTLQNATARDSTLDLLKPEWENFLAGVPAGQIGGNGAPSVDNRLPAAAAFVFDDHRHADWIALDPDATLAYFGIDPDRSFGEDGQSPWSIGDSTDNIREQTTAAYIEYEWNDTVAGNLLSANVGLRYYVTDTKTEFDNGAGIDTIEREDANLLPTANLRYELRDNIVLRAGISQNITRPDLEDLSGSPIIDTDDATNYTITGPNPELKPYFATSYDIAAEWYLDNADYLALSVFYKNIDNYIVTQTFATTYAETGLPESLLSPGVSPR